MPSLCAATLANTEKQLISQSVLVVYWRADYIEVNARTSPTHLEQLTNWPHHLHELLRADHPAAVLYRDEFLAGPEYDAVDRAGRQLRPAPRTEVLPGLGLGALVTGIPALRLAVKISGVAYMLWLAWKLSGAGKMAQLDPARLEVTFWQGVGLQFLNIKAWMLALTLTAGWVVNALGQPSANPLERLLIISAVMALFAFTSNFAYALTGSLLRQWLSEGRRLLWFNRSLAVVLAATAAWLSTV
jgi:threonine/homoserine/homoserine lactone efflux protein